MEYFRTMASLHLDISCTQRRLSSFQRKVEKCGDIYTCSKLPSLENGQYCQSTFQDVQNSPYQCCRLLLLEMLSEDDSGLQESTRRRIRMWVE
ncbi:hypothetical protein I7I48_03842 [Histoplasma ohiense]|nr:hypothetical protein I7I48_03842 [Histoplasma ohiense (nom. inval.)]